MATTYKYRIHYLLRQLSIEDYEVAMNFLPDFLGISKSSFKRWIYRKELEGGEIPANQLLKLARFFEVEPEEIYQNTVIPTSIEFKEKFKAFRSLKNQNHV